MAGPPKAAIIRTMAGETPDERWRPLVARPHGPTVQPDGHRRPPHAPTAQAPPWWAVADPKGNLSVSNNNSDSISS